MVKIGRNQLCPCGSGQKYKRCHGGIDHLNFSKSDIDEAHMRAEVARVQRERQQGLGKPIISAEVEGNRLVAVKDRLLHSKDWKTFHDFLFDYLKIILGPEWGNAELEKPPERRHPILNWYQKLCIYQQKFFTEPGKIKSAPMTGAASAYYHLAHDLYAMDHNAELQKKLVSRLRNNDNFEGARYEVYVAATFIRAGFELEFENEDDRSSSHCEFTATFKKTGRRFSVEAKHRAGTKLRLGHLLNGALTKHALYPRVVFIDVNIPDDGSVEQASSRMSYAVSKLRTFEGKPINGKQLPSAYIFVTNTPWHHHLDTSAFRWSVIADGFQIPDFKRDVPSPSLRAVIEARERHIEMHELLQSMQEHDTIPSTFDGSIPEFVFGGDEPRFLIGGRYLVEDSDGKECVGLLTSATVIEAEKKVYCGLTIDNGKSIICSWPLSDLEIAAWQRHPDTFFGELGQRTTKANSPLELYDFFLSTYRHTSKERLLEMMSEANDIHDLSKLSQKELAYIYCERSVYGAMATTSFSS